MFKYQGFEYTLDEVTQAANNEQLSVDEYVNKHGLETIEITDETQTIPTEGKTNGAAAKGATATPETGQAPESTDLSLGDTFLELQEEVDSYEPIDNSEEAIKARRKLAKLNKAFEIKLDPVVVTGVDIKKKKSNDILNNIGLDIYSNRQDKIAQTIAKAKGKENPDFEEINTVKDYTSFLTGAFNYEDLIDDVKIDEFSIRDLQATQQQNAFNQTYIELNNQYGENLNNQVLEFGANVLQGDDKKLYDLQQRLKSAPDGLVRQGIQAQIKTMLDDADSKSLYDYNTGNVYTYRKNKIEKKNLNTGEVSQVKENDVPDFLKEQDEKAKDKAKTTEVSMLEDELAKSYAGLVSISKTISQFENQNQGEVARSQNTPGSFIGDIKNLFGSEETVYGDLNRVNEIAQTGIIPQQISEIPGNHPLAKAFNKNLQEYIVLNKAIQTNVDPLSKPQEGFSLVLDKLKDKFYDFSATRQEPKLQFEVNQVFNNAAQQAGLTYINTDDLSEKLEQETKSVVVGGTMDLSFFMGELAVTRGATGNVIRKGSKAVEGLFLASNLAKKSKIVRTAGKAFIGGVDEVATFALLDESKEALGLTAPLTREETTARNQFAFGLGSGGSLAQGLLRALPAKTYLTPVLAQMNKSKIVNKIGNNVAGGGVGAFSFEFARALEAVTNKDKEYFQRSPEEFVKEYLIEVAKMSVLGRGSIFGKNSMLRAAQNDLRLIGLNPSYVNAAAKRTGFSSKEVKDPTENTVDDINMSRSEQMQAIDAKLKTGQITEEQAKKESDKANKDYNILEAEAEYNIAVEAVKAEKESGLQPSDTAVRVATNKIKRGETLNAEDNNAIVNTPTPILANRLNIESNSKSVQSIWNREYIINDILNNDSSFKAPYGTPQREASYKFLNESFNIGAPLESLRKRKNNLNEDQLKELERLEKDHQPYLEGGYKYEKLQDELNKFYLEQRIKNKEQAEEVLGATKEGESVPIKSVEELQRIYDEAFPNEPKDVSSLDGFYDPNKKVFYTNETQLKNIRNFTTDKHETGHFVLRDSLKNKAGEVTEEGIRIIDEVMSELTPKQREVVQNRIDDFYRFDSKGNERAKKDYYEEYLMVLSDAIANKQIVFKENVGNAFEKFVPLLRKKGAENLELNAETGKNLFELIKSYSKGEQAGIEAAKEISRAAEGVEVADQAAKLSSTTAQDLAVKFKSPEGLSRKEQADFNQQIELIALEALGYKQGKGTINRDEAVSFVNQYIPGILRRFDPSKRQISTFITSNIKPKRQKFYEQEIGTKPLETRISDERAREIADTQAEPLETKTEATTDFKLVDAIKINKEPISPDTKAEIRKLVTKETEGIDPNSDTFRKKALKPGSDLINFIKQEVLGGRSMQDYRNFIRQNPNFIKGLNIAQLIRFDTGLTKQGKPRLFTELNRRITKQGEIEKFIMQGKIPYLTTQQIKAGANLYNRLKPTETQLVNFLTNDTPQTVSNRKTAIASAIATKFIAEATPSTEAFKSKPLAEQAKIAEKLQVSPTAKFSETKQSGQSRLDSKIDKKALDLIRTDRSAKSDVLINTFPQFLPVDRFSRPTNWTSGNKLTTLQKRGFDIISDPRKISDAKLRAEAEQAVANGDIINLAELKQTAKANEKQFTQPELEAFNESFRGKNGPSWKKNLELKDLHDKGVDLQIDAELAIAKTSPESFAVLREYIYNPSLNANANRNQATAIGRELGALERKTQTTDEHVFQAIEHANARVQIYKNIIDGKPNAEKSLEYYKKWIKDNYLQYTLKNENDTLKGNLTDAEGNKWTNSGGTSHPVLMEQLNKAIESGKKEDWDKVPSSDLRYFNTYKNAKGDYVGLNPNNIYKGNESKAEEYNVVIPKKLQQNKNAIEEQNKIMESVILTEAGLLEGTKAVTRKQAKGIIDEYVKLVEGKTKAETKNNGELPPSLSFTEKQSNEKVLEELGTLDKALKVARDPKAPVKKIRVFDFDDTLARSNSKVIYEMPDGKTGKLNATQFAERAGELEAQGATFDFAEFSKVVDGKKGPVFKAIENIVAKRGAEDVFILTARPADAAGPIKEFMDALGVNLPIENIVGLGDGKAQAKARWVTGKAAEGYNDFFFVDDAYKNVKAVRNALEVFDVKSKTQQAKVMFSETVDLNKDFNDIIENKTGIGADKVYSRAKAQVVGASKGSIFKGIPYSAQDFTGLLYETLGKGKLGDQQMAWYKYNLLDPFAKGVNDISRDRVAMMNDYKSLKKELGVIPKDLRKKLPGEPYTKEQAVRVYTWNTLQGMEVPGVSKADLKTLNEFVNNSPELKVFAEQLVAINKGDGYAKPKETWLTGSITTDLLEGLNTTKRAKYLEQWQTNVDQIFSEANLNKLEAAYGKKYRKAIENSLQRMKTGRNRSFSDDGLTGRFTDWLNGSIGVTMFFNTRSALLQTLSSVNFVNFSDNNPLKAAKAFGNQKQYWKDFKYLMNSDFLKERRGGLRMNVNEADIAEAANKNGPRGVVNRLLQFGFTPTQIADSFAIASGGATFYRNRVKTYEKQGLSTAEAEAKAFEDFRETAEESQQSSRPDRISMQQAGPLGRPILAYGNTPAQYVRLTDKAIKDLKAGRGDAKTNISKIIYYTTVQNLIFNSLQQGLFAIAFGEADADDEKYEKKYVDVANGMADSILRGTGVGGAVISVGKNAIIRIMREQEKKMPKLEKVGYELTKISPPVSSKLSKINQAARSYQWDKDEMISKGFSIDNPAYLAGASVISATTNVPLDEAIKKVENVIAATEADKELWERLALFGGWSEWEIEEPEDEKKKKPKSKKSTSKFKKSKIK